MKLSGSMSIENNYISIFLEKWDIDLLLTLIEKKKKGVSDGKFRRYSVTKRVYRRALCGRKKPHG